MNSHTCLPPLFPVVAVCPARRGGSDGRPGSSPSLRNGSRCRRRAPVETRRGPFRSDEPLTTKGACLQRVNSLVGGGVEFAFPEVRRRQHHHHSSAQGAVTHFLEGTEMPTETPSTVRVLDGLETLRDVLRGWFGHDGVLGPGERRILDMVDVVYVEALALNEDRLDAIAQLNGTADSAWRRKCAKEWDEFAARVMQQATDRDEVISHHAARTDAEDTTNDEAA